MDESYDSEIESSISYALIAEGIDKHVATSEVVEDLTVVGVGDKQTENGETGNEIRGIGEMSKVNSRTYQIEMLEESLKRNIIVAMDTGSGKTHIAVLRIQAELDRISPDKIIWFLAPTVSLCSQQYEYIKSQVTSVQIKFLSGEDNVERWTQQRHWKVVLRSVSVVVSTYQILYDALSHGFVRMESLALIIFDEAHNCVGKHPGSKIMENFYHTRKRSDLPTPHILGLTASPVMRSNPTSLGKIENTLDAICRTPKIQRAELRLQVKLPVLSHVFYNGSPDKDNSTRSIESLGTVYSELNINEDPYVLSLLREGSEKSLRKLEQARLNLKSWAHDQMRGVYTTSLKIFKELGGWAADHYISEVISRFITLADTNTVQLRMFDLASEEKRYLANAFKQVETMPRATQPLIDNSSISDKVSKLIETLLENVEKFSGIIFVEERAMVWVLSHLLKAHRDTRHRFRIGTVVGISTSSYRSQNIGDLLGAESQKNTLSDFKTGAINLVIATNVLEEGMANDKRIEWEELEANMKKMYEDDMRALQNVLKIEDEEDSTTDHRRFCVENTGAILDLDNAVAHLHHFCSVLPAKEHVDLRPDFIFSTNEAGLVLAKVILPLSVAEEVRITTGRTSWLSEKKAMKDAAFEAYIALYNVGLVNDNLLPLLRHDESIDELTAAAVDTRPSIMVVNALINPWIDVAKAWRDSQSKKIIYTSTVISDNLEVKLLLPVKIPDIKSFPIYWDANTEQEIEIKKCEGEFVSDEILSTAFKDARTMLTAAYGHRFLIENKQLVVPFLTNRAISQDELRRRVVSSDIDFSRTGLIRDTAEAWHSYMFKTWLPSKPPIEQVQHPYRDYDEFPDEPHLALNRLPKRADFLHRVPQQQGIVPSRKQFSYVLPVSRCTMDDLPLEFIRFAILIPSIISRVEVNLIAEILSTTILKDVDIRSRNLTITAITASSASSESNYQRLEFLGDSILKTCTSIQIAGEYPLWHEGYLSAKKDRIVSNARLAKAAIQTGLDKFIITKSFTGLRWRPMYVEDLLDALPEKPREMSSKILADVVESLVGASMQDGGLPKALACLQTFLPEIEWLPLESRRTCLYQRAPDMQLPVALECLENLIGYGFSKQSLLIEAMTHASYNTGLQSLERLEFLGDSILDNIVVQTMWNQPTELSHIQMHLIRTALVNADFLAFICMEWSIDQEASNLVEVKGRGRNFTYDEVASTVRMPFWKFLRHASPEMAKVEITTSVWHNKLRNAINEAIQTGKNYPWALLAKLQAQKFYSDMIESLLGAIWVDSGSFEICTQVVERMGILPYLRRILRDDVHILHPKEEIGQLADSETVKYKLCNKLNEATGEREYLCKLLVGERDVVEVDGGVSKMEVQTKAAEMAVEILKAEKAQAARMHMDGGDEGDRMDVDEI